MRAWARCWPVWVWSPGSCTRPQTRRVGSEDNVQWCPPSLVPHRGIQSSCNLYKISLKPSNWLGKMSYHVKFTCKSKLPLWHVHAQNHFIFVGLVMMFKRVLEACKVLIFVVKYPRIFFNQIFAQILWGNKINQSKITASFFCMVNFLKSVWK